MSITGYKLKPDSVRFTLAARGERKRRAVWTIRSSDRSDGSYSAALALGVAPGDTYTDGIETDTSVVCTDVSVSRVEADGGVVFEAEANYTSHPNKKPEENNDDLTSAPVDRPPDIRWGEEAHQIPLERAYLVTNDVAAEALTAVRNSAGGPFSKTIYVPVYRQTYTVTRNEATFPRALSELYAYRCNDGDFMGDAAGTWLCKPITGTWIFERIGGLPVGYWRVTYSLVFDPNGWDTFFLDEGDRYFFDTEAGARLIKAVDDRGLPCGFVPLDGNGRRLQQGNWEAGEFQYRRYRTCTWADFDSLNLEY